MKFCRAYLSILFVLCCLSAVRAQEPLRFVKATDIQQFIGHERFILVAENQRKAAGTFMSPQTPSYLKACDITFEDDGSVIASDDVAVFELSSKTKSGKWAFKLNDSYITTSNSNKKFETVQALSEGRNWTLAKDNGGIAFQSDSYHYISYDFYNEAGHFLIDMKTDYTEFAHIFILYFLKCCPMPSSIGNTRICILHTFYCSRCSIIAYYLFFITFFFF